MFSLNGCCIYGKICNGKWSIFPYFFYSVIQIHYNLLQDCNGDGKIDCVDYFSLHLHGPTGCHLANKDEGEMKINKCLMFNRFLRRRGLLVIRP